MPVVLSLRLMLMLMLLWLLAWVPSNGETAEGSAE